MLNSLVVKNFAIIDDLTINFYNGMTVITGDSGAGKSIIIQALTLALGTRSDKSSVKKGVNKAQIVADFDINNPKITNFLEKNQLDNDCSCILRRIISIDGRSKAFINDFPVSLNLLQQLSNLLINIFSQNQHQLLLKTNHQMQILDDYSNTVNLRKKVLQICTDINKLAAQIKDINSNNANNISNLEFLNFQLKELNDADFELTELQNIENDYKISNNSQELINNINSAINIIDDDNFLSYLDKINSLLESSSIIDPKLKNAKQILASANINISECSYELNNYINSYELDTQDIKYIETRISLLHNLSRKHNCQILNLIDIQNNLKNKVLSIDNSDNSALKLQEKINQLELEYQQITTKLTQKRALNAKILSSSITKLMQELGMPGSEFMVSFIRNEIISTNGAESIEFLIKTNIDGDFSPLKKTASGGELSRISLAMAVTTTSNTYAPSLIFDEVDVGISGRAASVVGDKLKNLSKKYQVICITHLPQVATKGERHLLISKTKNATTTNTCVNYLTGATREEEIARILGGDNISKKTLALAKEMIDGS